MPNLNTASVKANATGATTTRTLGNRFADVLNVRDFGATGAGIVDDGPAIQACFDAAFGTSGSPHGTGSLKYTNKSVYIPAGLYNVNSPLYLTSVEGGHIFGDGQDVSVLSYTGTPAGNTVAQGNLSAPDIATVRAITPLIITQGFAYSRISDLGLSGGGAAITCFYLFWNGTGGAGPTANTFTNVFCHDAQNGVQLGYLTPGLCSETTFITCTASGCTGYALNNLFFNCGADHCGTGFSVLTGQIGIYGCSLAVNTTDISLDGSYTIPIVGARTESNNFLNLGNGQAHAHVSSCMQIGASAGYFVNLANGSSVILDGCQATSTGSTTGLIQGNNCTVFIRGGWFRNTSFLSTLGSNATVAEYSMLPTGSGGISDATVAHLPAAATWFRGTRTWVTDSNLAVTSNANFGTDISTHGGGTNAVPLFCDGSAWRIG